MAEHLTLEAARARMREAYERTSKILSDPEYQKRAAELRRALAEDDVRQRRYSWRARGIPEAFIPVIESPREEPALVAVRRFVAGPWQDPAREGTPLALILAGAVGRGKSIAAAWAAASDRWVSYYAEAMDLIQSGIFGGDRREGYWLQRVPLLVLDELGTEPLDQAGWGESKFYDLLNARLQNRRRTILVTNLDPQAFIARYPDKRLRDRLRAHADVFVAVGPSLRGA